MDKTFQIVLLSVVMFITTFTLSYLPTKLNTSMKVMNIIAIYGAGLLVGAALIVIIPEGIVVLYSSLHQQGGENDSKTNSSENDDHIEVEASSSDKTLNMHMPGKEHGDDHDLASYVGLSLIFGFTVMLALDESFKIIKEWRLKRMISASAMEGVQLLDQKVSQTEDGVHTNNPQNKRNSLKHHRIQEGLDEEDYNEPLLESEHLGTDKQRKSQQQPLEPLSQRHVQNQSYNMRKNSAELEENLASEDINNILKKRGISIEDYDQHNQQSLKEALRHEKLHIHQHDDHFTIHEHYHGDHQQVLVTTTGLVIHSIADGLAMGASLFSIVSHMSDKVQGLGILIFFALLMHKAPESFGFGTFLCHEGLGSKDVFKHVLAFTLTSPVAAIGAYFGLFSFNIEGSQQALMFWVGILLLISAGSFLYVATIHILPEVFCNSEAHRPHTHHHLPECYVHDDLHFPKAFELFVIILGLYTPYILTALTEK